jgi:hypothetical protein
LDDPHSDCAECLREGRVQEGCASITMSMEIMWKQSMSHCYCCEMPCLSYPLPCQLNLVRIAHPQEQFHVTVLRRSQGSLSRLLEALIRLTNHSHTMILQQTRQHCNKLYLSEFYAGAILGPVGPGEVRALHWSNYYLLTQSGGQVPFWPVGPWNKR